LEVLFELTPVLSEYINIFVPITMGGWSFGCPDNVGCGALVLSHCRCPRDGFTSMETMEDALLLDTIRPDEEEPDSAPTAAIRARNPVCL
jgi:hypothetical protein